MSAFCAQHVASYVAAAYEREGDGDVQKALASGIRAMETAMLRELHSKCETVGTTALVAVLSDATRSVTIANIGDSRAVCSDGTRLTTDHNFESSPSERARVEGLGGVLEGRSTFQSLCVSRSLGDLCAKPHICSEPDVATHAMGPGRLLVLATDGLWSVMSDRAAGDFVVREMRHKRAAAAAGNCTPRPLCGEVAQCVAMNAWRELGSQDNIAVVVVAPTAAC